ncbi:dTMP kinase [Paucibacter sp. B2R-40]|uniref:dTMP kinase n=1 Tax=Paucibacter sp. B2R-40 TaxID=2893554 RepID=UPI0021E50B9E|nr:dTMP kinase [Paucibacter sp. B2R-40]MCV2355873.1 dTMP kinase [Paucibacter sp. B2R-40]
MTARFITFEGIDGAGKSTHIAALTERLSARGAVVVNTREPGGTELAETLRGLFLHSGMDSLTEALLVFAGRRDHLQRVIEPALAAGQTVLCDRYTDASFAYQGAGRGMDLTVLTTLEQWVQNGRQPDLTLWFDLPAEMAATRRAAAREADRFEQQDLDFFERVRGGYAARAAAAPQRFARIDASGSVAEVAAQISAVMEARGW